MSHLGQSTFLIYIREEVSNHIYVLLVTLVLYAKKKKMEYKTYQQVYTENYRCYFRGLTNYYPWLCSLRYSDSLWTWVCYCESTLLRNSVLNCVTQEEPSWWFDKTCLKDGSGSDLFFPFTHSSEDLAKR